jgi:hypothetical protein
MRPYRVRRLVTVAHTHIAIATCRLQALAVDNGYVRAIGCYETETPQRDVAKLTVVRFAAIRFAIC